MIYHEEHFRVIEGALSPFIIGETVCSRVVIYRDSWSLVDEYKQGSENTRSQLTSSKGHALPSCFSSYTVNNGPLLSLFSVFSQCHIFKIVLFVGDFAV